MQIKRRKAQGATLLTVHPVRGSPPLLRFSAVAFAAVVAANTTPDGHAYLDVDSRLFLRPGGDASAWSLAQPWSL